MKRVFNVGVIGVGTIGKAHLQAYSNQKNAKVVAISDINEKELKSTAGRFGVGKCFTDYHDLLALDEVDAVSICTPPFNHAEITCGALRWLDNTSRRASVEKFTKRDPASSGGGVARE